MSCVRSGTLPLRAGVRENLPDMLSDGLKSHCELCRAGATPTSLLWDTLEEIECLRDSPLYRRLMECLPAKDLVGQGDAPMREGVCSLASASSWGWGCLCLGVVGVQGWDQNSSLSFPRGPGCPHFILCTFWTTKERLIS